MYKRKDFRIFVIVITATYFTQKKNNMKTTKRYKQASNKLYNAFNNGKLDAMDCKHCAVGNLCGNSMEWVNSAYIGNPKNRVSRTFENNTGYTPEELATVEALFIYGTTEPTGMVFNNDISNKAVAFGYRTKQQQRELQFKGLMAVLNYLAELDGIESIETQYKQFKSVLDNETITV